MSVIYKYQLGYNAETEYYIPAGAKFLDAQMQDSLVCVWAEVDLNQPSLPVKFLIVGTGIPTDLEGWEYIGTAQQMGYVWHIYYQCSE